MSRFTGLPRWLLLLLLCLLPTLGFALGFGEVKLHSYIDEPMDAEIELLGAESFEPERILVSLASAQEFKRAGLARPFLLSQLQFQVLRTMTTTVIRVTSHEAIRQPYLEFLIDLSWPGGRLVRGYTLLLDPAPPGTVPLAQRRPAVVSRAIKENTTNQISLHPVLAGNNANPVNANANNAGNTGNKTENNFSQNTMPQNIMSQSTVPQNTISQSTMPQNIMSQNVGSRSHQQRFEKLFDERTGELNANGEAAPMIIVSAPETASTAMQGQGMQQGSYPIPVNPQSGYQNSIYGQQAVIQQNGLPQQGMLQQQNMNNMNQQGVQTFDAQSLVGQGAAGVGVNGQMQRGTQAVSGLDKLSFTFDKIEWLLICIAFSILLLCVTLIVVLARRNKFKINDVASREAMMDMAAMQSHMGAHGTQSYGTPLSASPGASHVGISLGASSGTAGHHGNFSSPYAIAHGQASSTAQSSGQGQYNDRHLNDRYLQEDLKLNTPIQNEMTMKLELAKNYFEIGDDENALVLLEDVASRGTEWEKLAAQRLLAESANAGTA